MTANTGPENQDCVFPQLWLSEQAGGRVYYFMTRGVVNCISGHHIPVDRASLSCTSTTSHSSLSLKSSTWISVSLINYLLTTLLSHVFPLVNFFFDPSAVFSLCRSLFLSPPPPRSPPSSLDMRELSELPWPAPVGQLEEEHLVREQGDLPPWTHTPSTPPPTVPSLTTTNGHTCSHPDLPDPSCCPTSAVPPSQTPSGLQLHHLHLSLPVAVVELSPFLG